MSVFEVGDLCLLKSGSPPLTVERINDGVLITVIWFVDGKVERAHLSAFALVKKAA